jgi:hypothetical protein
MPAIGGPSPGSRRVAGLRALPPRSLSTATAWAQCYVDDRDEGGFRVPRYLLIKGTKPRWRLHDTVDSADLEKSLARVMENGVITYTAGLLQ